MDNLLYKTAIKYSLIAIGLSLLSSLPMLIGGAESKIAIGLTMGLSILNILLMIIIYVVAILEFSRKRNHQASTGEIFGLAGMIAGISFVFSLIMSFAFVSLNSAAAIPDFGSGSGNMGFVTIMSFATGSCMTFLLAIAGVQLAGIWRTFQKAGKEGWECIVPIYNYMVMSEIGKNPSWWGLMLLIPLVNIVFIIMILNGISKAFGKDGAWTVGLFFLGFIFWPMLAWGGAKYQYGDFETPFAQDVSDHLVD